jgi:hypothetical protein
MSSWRAIATRLDAEWATVVETTPSTVLARWGAAYPRLADLTTLDDIQTRVDSGRYPVRDGILLALIQLTQDGHQLAGRVLIHLLQKALSTVVIDLGRIVTTLPVSQNFDIGDQLLGALWEVIATYPVDARPTRVAQNLILDTRRVVLHGNGARSVAGGIAGAASRHETLTGGTPVDDTATTPPVDQTWIETHALEEVVSTLAWAVRQRVITPDDATLLTGMCTGPKPATATYAYDHAAQTQGITPDAARKRASRAITQLRRHLATTAA